jgi:hypothetical protein
MTEANWLTCADPDPMLDAIGGQASIRKLRLLACACCRRVWPMLADERSRCAVEVAERWALGAATDGELRLAATAAAEVVRNGLEPNHTLQRAAVHAALVPTLAVNGFECPDTEDVRECLCDAPGLCVIGVADWTADEYHRLHEGTVDGEEVTRGADVASGEAYNTEVAAQAVLVREIFGNPFRPVAVDPAWLTSDVVLLAQGIYDERAFDRLPILADALQDAGCDCDDLLAHLRGPGPHVRGCWALDLVLGKE